MLVLSNKKTVIKIALLVISILSLLCLTTGCYNYDSDTPYFPVLRGKVGMEALATGNLILENGYLRLSTSYSETTYLIIWPKEYTLDKDSDGILILNEDGQLVVRVGDNISAVGGEMKNMFNLWLIGVFVPLSCEGPYWVTDDVWIT